MKRLLFVVLTAVFLTIGGSACSSGRAEDSLLVQNRIVITDADQKPRTQNTEQAFYGKIISTGKTQIVINTGQEKITVPTEKVLWILYDQEPLELTTARLLFRTSDYQEAVKKLSEIPNRTVFSPAIREEIDFLELACAGEEALLNTSRFTRQEKEKRADSLVRFLADHSKSSHYYYCLELAGKLFQGTENLTKALQMFDLVSEAPWRETQTAALLEKGRILIQLGRPNEAERILAPTAAQGIRYFLPDNKIKTSSVSDNKTDPLPISGNKTKPTGKNGNKFNSVDEINIDKRKPDPIIDILLVRAQMTYFDALAAQKKFTEGINGYRQLTRTTDHLPSKIRAQIYNGTGRILEAADNPGEAVHAFLHVDLLYSGEQEEHIEALRHLSDLWHRLGHDDRAREAEQTLLNRYEIDPKDHH